MENIATTSVCTNAKYGDGERAIGIDVFAVADPHVDSGPAALCAAVDAPAHDHRALKVVTAPKVPDRDMVIYITVGDSGFSMVSGGKNKLRKYDFSERLDTSRPARVGAWKSEMLWGKGLRKFASGSMTDFPTATIIPMIYWKGNKLVGNGIYPYDTPMGDAIQLLEDTRHLLWTMNFAARKGCACLGVLTGGSSVQYGCSTIWDRFMSEVCNFIINEPSQMLVYVDAAPFIETIDLLDRYHMCFSDDNIIKTVQFMRGTHHMLYMLSICNGQRSGADSHARLYCAPH